MKQLFTIRMVFLEICLLVIAMFSAAAYLQYEMGLLPCPLCQLQRIMLGVIGVIAFFAVIHGPKSKGIKFYSFLVVFSSIVGGALAARQVFLQYQPSTGLTGNCGVGLDYILQTLPLLEAFKFIIQGAGSCATVTWRLVGLSLAEWTLIAFALFALLGCIQHIRAKKA